MGWDGQLHTLDQLLGFTTDIGPVVNINAQFNGSKHWVSSSPVFLLVLVLVISSQVLTNFKWQTLTARVTPTLLNIQHWHIT